MEIDINNYESVLIDYFDGNLNALEVAEVLLFLEQHPEIKREFEAIGNLPQPQTIAIEEDFKLQLKKLNNDPSLGEKSFNELIIATMEGDCNEIEKTKINQLIAGNESLLKLKKLFLLTKLTPNLQIIYPNKASLKKKEAIVFYLTRRFAAAAAILLLATLLFLVYRNTGHNVDSIDLAQLVKPVIKQTDIKNEAPLEDVTPSKTVLKAKEVNQITSTQTALNNNQVLNTPADIRKDDQMKFVNLPMKPLASIQTIDIAINSQINSDIQVLNFQSSSLPLQEEKFLTISNWVKMKLIERGKNNLVENEKPLVQEEITLDPLTVASIGAGIVEKTTGKKVYLSRSFDKTGIVKSYTFAAGNFKFERIK